MPIDFNQLREFLEAIAKTEITDLTIKEGEFELNMSKELQSPVAHIVPTSAEAIMERKETTISVEKATAPPPSEEISLEGKYANWIEITSPMVGTFYRAAAPGESPFVEIGDRISRGQVVSIIEAMKFMNEIEAEVAGEVVEIAVENGEPIEYGQTLMWVNPS